MARSAVLTPRPGARGVALYRLAWRNLWRQRRRTLLLLLVVAYATLATVLFWGLQDGFTASIQRGYARFLGAPVLIATSAYFQDPDPEHGLPTLAFLDRLRGQPGVGAAAPRLEFSGLLRSAYAALPAKVRGVDPRLEARVSGVPEAVRQGRMLRGPGEIVLGRALAAQLDVRLGERVVLEAAALAGPQARGFRVVGLVDSGLRAVDEGLALVHLEDARALTGLGTATGVALEAPRGQEARIAQALAPLLPPGLEARDLERLLGGLAAAIASKNASIFLIGAVLALFAALAVTSTVLVSVLERTREFGVMEALGLTPGRLAQMIVLETLFTVVLGWGVGLGVGYGLNAWMAHHNVLGPLFAGYGEAFQALGVGGEIYTAQSPVYALYAGLTVLLALLFALLIPARRVYRQNPVEALRSE